MCETAFTDNLLQLYLGASHLFVCTSNLDWLDIATACFPIMSSSTSSSALPRSTGECSSTHATMTKPKRLQSVRMSHDAAYSLQKTVPSDISASVDYARISSDYLRGHAASVHHLAKEVHKQTSRVYTTVGGRINPPPGALQLSHAVLTLNRARRHLLHDFHQFESDSSAWANLLKNGDDTVSRHRCQPNVYVEQASQVMDAVNQARVEVQKACGESLWEELSRW